MRDTIPLSVLVQYDIGKIFEIYPVRAGLVHKTFFVKADQGQYIIQRLHSVLASQAIADDFFAVTQYLSERGFLAPVCVLTKTGQVLAEDKGDRWRMQTHLPGKTVEILEDHAMAKEAGEIYAQLHAVLCDIPYVFKSTLMLHQTKNIFQTFVQIVESQDDSAPSDRVQDEICFLTKTLPEFFLPDTLPQRVIHGDPKISNILFTSRGRAMSIIDLDTCNRSSILVELGDAFRSWCGGKENDPKNRFDLDVFASAWEGYQAGAANLLTQEERSWLPTSIGTITLELATRFLTDYFTDNYFGWDQERYTSRREHNLARCRGQIAEFLDYQEKLESIKQIVGMKL